MKTLLKSLGLIAVLLLFLPSEVYALEGIPKGTFHFSESGVLSNSDEKAQKELFNQILKGKQSDAFTEYNKLGSDGFETTIIKGDLNTESGTSMWNYNLQDLHTRTSGMTIKMMASGKPYSIYLPPGKNSSGQINTAILNNAIAGIEDYKEAVQEGVLAASLGLSFNSYSMYPSKQVPVVDILEEEKKDGKKTGVIKIKASGGGVTMNYSLLSFYNPFFGKMDTKTLGKGDDAYWNKYWKGKVSSVKLKFESEDKVSFEVSDAYNAFFSEFRQSGGTFSEVNSDTVVKTDGVRGYTPSLTKKGVKPRSVVDGLFQLVVPNVFSVKDSRNYNLNADSNGFKTVGDFKLLLTNNLVFNKEGKLGQYVNYGIDPKSLVLHAVKVNDKGAVASDGKLKGVVVSLWYKEAILDTRKEAASEDDKGVYLTGRKVKFGNDYSGKISLDTKNKDLLGVESKANGLQNVALRDYAFKEGGKHTVAEDHTSVTTKPEKFALNVTFENTELVKGFVIYRNNLYNDDAQLTKWLETEEAKALTEVKAETLHSLITGEFEVDPTVLSYDQWNRLEEIRGELDTSLQSKLTTIIRVITLLFGVFVIFYSIMLVLAYWFDQFNVLLDFSLLNLMTNKKLYPIANKDEVEYMTSSDGVKYVTFWNVLFLMFVGISIGLVFIYSTPIIELLSFMYYKITNWAGAI